MAPLLKMRNCSKLLLKRTSNITGCRREVHSLSVIMTCVALQQGISGLPNQDMDSLWITAYQVLLHIYGLKAKGYHYLLDLNERAKVTKTHKFSSLISTNIHFVLVGDKISL